MKNAFEYEAELAALREELAKERRWKDDADFSLSDYRRRLADAERRNVELTEAMERIHFRCESFSNDDRGMKIHSVQVMLDIASKVLRPTESGASE